MIDDREKVLLPGVHLMPFCEANVCRRMIRTASDQKDKPCAEFARPRGHHVVIRRHRAIHLYFEQQVAALCPGDRLPQALRRHSFRRC